MVTAMVVLGLILGAVSAIGAVYYLADRYTRPRREPEVVEGPAPSALMYAAMRATQQRAARQRSSWHIPPEVVQWLRNLYEPLLGELNGSFVSRGPHLYPAAFFPAKGQSLEAVLPPENINLDTRIQKGEINENAIPRRRRHGLDDDATLDEEWDTVKGDNLCMSTLEIVEGKPVLTARVGMYGQIMDSSDAMIDEVLAVPIDRLKEEPPDQVLNSLALRSSIDRNPFCSAWRRAAGIGVSALVCYPSGNDLAVIVAQRSLAVSTWKRAWHVFPSGMLGERFRLYGYTADHVLRAMLIEFAEELMGQEEAELRQTSPDFAEKVRERWLSEARIALTGVAFDLLNLRPEICGLIMTMKPDWLKDLKPNWEVDGIALRDRILYPVGVGNNDDKGLSYMKPEDSVPSGAAAFWAGVDMARRLKEEGK